MADIFKFILLHENWILNEISPMIVPRIILDDKSPLV